MEEAAEKYALLHDGFEPASSLDEQQKFIKTDFIAGAKWQSEQSPSACKESQGDIAEFKSIVEDLAAWSKKYPRGTVYSFNEKIDEQLIAIEERAKELIQRFT